MNRELCMSYESEWGRALFETRSQLELCGDCSKRDGDSTPVLTRLRFVSQGSLSVYASQLELSEATLVKMVVQSDDIDDEQNFSGIPHQAMFDK